MYLKCFFVFFFFLYHFFRLNVCILNSADSVIMLLNYDWFYGLLYDLLINAQILSILKQNIQKQTPTIITKTAKEMTTMKILLIRIDSTMYEHITVKCSLVWVALSFFYSLLFKLLFSFTSLFDVLSFPLVFASAFLYCFLIVFSLNKYSLLLFSNIKDYICALLFCVYVLERKREIERENESECIVGWVPSHSDGGITHLHNTCSMFNATLPK